VIERFRRREWRAMSVPIEVILSAAVGLAVGFGIAQITGEPASGALPSQSASPAPDLLDGTAELQPQALAELARQRAALGADWLAGAIRGDGSFYYEYDPETDEYDLVDYNEVRHAGTTYSIFLVHGLVGGEDVLEAAEAAARYIDVNAVPVKGGRAFVYEGEMKLGGQALALVALLERRRVLDDENYDELIGELAAFMVSLELPDQPGRYFMRYDVATATPQLEPDSDFYPGEALLALTRLAEHFPDAGYLEYATRAAEYLVHVRDGDLPALGAAPRDDHWLTMALAELYRLRPDEDYRSVAYLQAERMLANQYRPDTARPMQIGASVRTVINYTSTATKGEAFIAAWALAVASEEVEAAERYATAALRNAQFQMRVQYTADNTQLFPRPEAAIGAWSEDIFDAYVRVDFVQHNVSALAGIWYMIVEGDLPLASE
jgi:hypothetical protein